VDWIFQLSEWARTTIGQVGTSPVTLPFAFVLGLASAAASTCCALPVIGAVVGYAGIQENIDKRSNLLAAFFFMIGTIISLLILGSVAGLIGQVAQSVLGSYWKIFAGIVAIIVGLGAMNLFPFNIPVPGKKSRPMQTQKRGLIEAAIVGFVMGGAISVCSLSCNPGILIILGVAVIQGYTLWMYSILSAYAIGFSLPLAALMLGVSLSKSAIRFKEADKAIRIAAGAMFIVVGFYFLSTF
jgi:cytochrome c biogenesis protein CcdA